MKKQTLRTFALTAAFLFSTTNQIAPAEAADANINSLVKRLNSKGKLWQINIAASSSAGAQSRQRLGLYQQPNAIIECNIRMSGTWLFVYKKRRL
jgi:alpha-D-ribose 1-methylphosphonate 5-triphosphate synthase subunit PhnL